MSTALLASLSLLYSGVVATRGWLYGRGWLVVRRLPVPVISVGNLTVGGTGKSPMVALVARALAAIGARPAIVSRGYGGEQRKTALVVSDGGGARVGARLAGDEPVMLAGLVPGVPVIVSPRRVDGGMLAVTRFAAGCVVLDDGFQHRALARDLDLLLVDASEQAGGQRLLPAGRLREPLSAMGRAGALLLTRCDRSRPEILGGWARLASRLAPAAPVFHAGSRAVAVVGEDGVPAPLERLKGARVACFAGIARPELFFEDVERAGAMVTARLSFPDHHRFTASDLRAVGRAAAEGSADLILTTEKDAARLRDGGGDRPKNLHALRIESFVENEEREAFDRLLRRAVAR